jgi:hypothetical protein
MLTLQLALSQHGPQPSLGRREEGVVGAVGIEPTTPPV